MFRCARIEIVVHAGQHLIRLAALVHYSDDVAGRQHKIIASGVIMALIFIAAV